MFANRRCVFAVLLATALPAAAWSTDSSWKMPNLNPFSSQGKAPTSSRASNAPTSGWKMPKLWPSTTNAPAKRRPSQPSTMSKMTKGTQQFFSKTADAINPFDDKKPQPQPSVTGSNTRFTHNQPAKKEQKSSGISPASWWGGEDTKSQNPKTVGEFLAQPRPQ
jgi:hypothetical protein